MGYSKIPLDCRTNNYIESYDYLKTHFGKKRIINWINLIHFIKTIKTESKRGIEKLYNNKNSFKINTKENDILEDNKIENNENDMEI